MRKLFKILFGLLIIAAAPWPSCYIGAHFEMPYDWMVFPGRFGLIVLWVALFYTGLATVVKGLGMQWSE